MVCGSAKSAAQIVVLGPERAGQVWPLKVRRCSEMGVADCFHVSRQFGGVRGARHHAKWRELTEDEETAAVTEFRALAGGRGVLLAEVAGVLEEFSVGKTFRLDA